MNTFSLFSRRVLVWYNLHLCKVGVIHTSRRCGRLTPSVILQMRLYVLYDCSKRVLFITVSGFIIEIAVFLVIGILKYDAFGQLDLTDI